jgi:hypothetical protein
MSPNNRTKKSKLSPTVIIALIGLAGTVITALLTSPVLIELIKKSSATETLAGVTAVPPANATLVFDKDFEDGVVSGFAFRSGDWEMTKDKSNRVLEFTATGPEAPAAVAYFGSPDFSDGVVEFRVRFITLFGMYFDFRQQDDAVYVLSLDPDSKVVLWAVNAVEAFYAVGPDTSQPFTFQKDVWYTVRLEARGERVTVNIDGNRILSGSDARLASGRIRFALQPNAVVYLDDVKVWSFEP